MRLLRRLKVLLHGVGYTIEMEEAFKSRCEALFQAKYPHNAIRLEVWRESIELVEEYLRLQSWEHTLPSPDGLHYYIKGVSRERGLIDPIGLAEVYYEEEFVFPSREEYNKTKENK